jgi:catechol 2,3-dioxygenase-like lactoylglutathione lyase family enzyme
MGRMLSQQPLVAFVGVSDPAKAKAFYQGVLGLRLVLEQLPFALVFDARGVQLRVSIVPKVVVAGYTVLGWEAADLRAEVTALVAAGVEFARFPGLEQDDLGIWTAPGGTGVAWFRDPDGNVLSLSQHNPAT